MTLLAFDDVDVWYRRRGAEPQHAVAGVSLAVGKGELVTIVGESGSGKSTLVRAAIGLLPATSRVSGAVRLDGVEVSGWSHNRFARYRGRFVGYIPQDPAVSLNPVKQVGRHLEEALRNRAGRGFRFRGQFRAAALRFLGLAGLPDPVGIYRKYPHELSGGMKQRVLIAIALSGEPELLIADEPTSALDVTVQKQILDHLDLLRAELGIGILLVTHDLGVALERADRVVVMRAGSVVETGTADEILHGARDEYTRALLAAAPGLHPRRIVARPIDPGSLAHARAAVGGPADIGEAAGGSRGQVGGADVDGAEFAIGVRELRKTFRTRRGGVEHRVAAVDGVSFTVAPGSTHALVGESGAGKSTVARIVAGLTGADSGEVRLFGSTERDRAALQFVYQNPYSSLNPRFSVADLITEPIRVHRRQIGRRERHAIAAELLDGVRLPRDYAARRAGELSGGQAQRVAIARALALNPRVVVLDEAVSALDVSVQAEILQLLTDLQAAYALTYLFITHDLGVVKLFADTVTVLRAGRVVETADTATVLDAPRSDYTRRLVDSVPGIDLFPA
ncbi:ATP-binding cassette domain-containing protein [Nocardia sp. NPDC057227]|uniref:ATP-binding cassette domain-containing protein n=1 Tax=Nocardia sp. NPDC057227 TaxID=3346056 RepID=UPI00362771A5